MLILSILGHLHAREAEPRMVYRCLRTDKTIQLDGSLEDELWKETPATPITRAHARAGAGPEKIAPSDLSGTWRARWNDGHLYLGIEVLDDVIMPFSTEGPAHQNDSVELFFDINHDYRQGFQYPILPFGRDGKGATISRVIPGLDLKNSGVRVASRRTKTGYTLEVDFPWKHFFHDTLTMPRHGSDLGFDVALLDMDGTNQPLKAMNWNSRGGNWRDPSQNGTLLLVKDLKEKVTPRVLDQDAFFENHHTSSVWPYRHWIEGSFILSCPHQSYSRTEYRPWHFGELRARALDADHARLQVSRDRAAGPCSNGAPTDDVEDHRINLTVQALQTNGQRLILKRIKTPYHPALSYLSNETEIGLFQQMRNYAQPTGPSYFFLPLEKGVTLYRQDGASRYERDRDGRLKAGWALVGFHREGDGRANDMPMLVMFNQNPAQLRLQEAQEEGLTLRFGDTRLHSIAFLPLYGLKGTDAATIQRWLKSGVLPAEVLRQIDFWYRGSLALPIELEQKVSYLQEDGAFLVTNQFSYTDNLSEWSDPPLYLSPVTSLMGRALQKRKGLASEGSLEEVDFPMSTGNFFCVRDTTQYTIRLQTPPLEPFDPKVLDPQLLAQHPLGKKYLGQLDLKKIQNQYVGPSGKAAALNKPYFMPHTWPPVPGFAGEEYLRSAWLMDGEARREFYAAIAEVFETRTLNPEWEKRLFPAQTPYLGSPLRVPNLTQPYGCPEPMWNICVTLENLAAYADISGDYELYRRHWPLIRRISGILWDFGHGMYAYDQGLRNLNTLKGLVRAAEAVGDRQFQIQALYRLTELCYTIPAYFAIHEFAARNQLWSANGVTPALHGPVQNLAIDLFLTPIEQGKIWTAGQFCFDISYGDPAIMRDFALEEIRDIEERILPLATGKWDERAYPAGTTAYPRFLIRAFTLREDLSHLDAYLDALKKSGDAGYTFAVIAMLRRIGEEVKTE